MPDKCCMPSYNTNNKSCQVKTLQSLKKSKFIKQVEEAINLVPQMDTETTYDAVECWNSFSEKLQDIVHRSAEFAEIEAIALSMDEAESTSAAINSNKSTNSIVDIDFDASAGTTRNSTAQPSGDNVKQSKNSDFAVEKSDAVSAVEEPNNNSLMDAVDELVNCTAVSNLDCLEDCAEENMDNFEMSFGVEGGTIAASSAAMTKVASASSAERRSHREEKTWECSVCGGRFKQRKSLKVHMRKHTGDKPYQCAECGKSFTQSGSLRSHAAVHADARPHACAECGRAFRQRSQLRTHQQRHAKLKRFQCTVCHFKFLTRGDLRRHEKTHTGERLFRCELCDKSYARRQSLEFHLRRRCGLTTIDLDQLIPANANANDKPPPNTNTNTSTDD